MSIEHTNLPIEVLCNPLSYLSPKELSVFTVDKYLFEASTTNALWQGFCMERKVTPQEGESFKQAYIGDLKKYCTYFYQLFKSENLVSAEKADVFEKKDQIDEKLKDKANELYNELTLSLIEGRASVETVRFLIEAGALGATIKKWDLITTALEYKYPWEIVELFMENGEVVTKEVIKKAIFGDISPQNVQLLYESFLKTTNAHVFERTFFITILCTKVKTNDPVMLMIIDHLDLAEKESWSEWYLQMILSKGCSDCVIRKVIEKFEIKLDLSSLETLFSNHKSLLINLYLEDKTLPLSKEFLDTAIDLLSNMEISLELMMQIIDHMNLAGVKFSESQLERLTQPEMDVWHQLGEESRLELLSKIKRS